MKHFVLKSPPSHYFYLAQSQVVIHSLFWHCQIERKAAHFAYGHGPHYCLGAKLGRLQIRLLFEELFKELPLLILNKEVESIRDHYSLSFSGFENLELVQAVQ